MARRITDNGLAPVAQRLVEKTIETIAARGIENMTIEDIARDAGCSRATLYRYFPGKQQLLRAALQTEVGRAVRGLEEALDVAETLEDVVVNALMYGSRVFIDHAALRALLGEDPEMVMPFLSFGGADGTHRISAGTIAPRMARFGFSHSDGTMAGQWFTRLVLSYVATPSDTVDLEDEASVRSLVRTLILPGLAARQARSSSN